MPALAVDDLKLAADLLWPGRPPPGLSLEDLHYELAPATRLRLPPLARASATAACRSACLIQLLFPLATMLLSARNLLTPYRDLDARLLPLLSGTATFFPLLDASALKTALQRATLALQEIERLLAEAGGADLDPTSEESVRVALWRVGAPPLGDPAIGTLRDRVRQSLASCGKMPPGSPACHLLHLLDRCAASDAFTFLWPGSLDRSATVLSVRARDVFCAPAHTSLPLRASPSCG